MSISYLICYETENIEVDLPVDATVETLQNKIYELTKLRPSHQYIAELAYVPQTQLVRLVSSSDNVLWLSKETVTYDICYKSDKISVSLPIDATIENLENIIFDKTGLRPSHQYISELDSFPKTQVLVPVCPNGKTLKLTSKERTLESRKQIAEETACMRFIREFNPKYGRNHINFQCSSLKQTITNSCLGQQNLRKLVLLYFHNECDQFSKEVCSGFVKGEMRQILDESYDVLAWDLSTNLDGLLENVLDEWLELKVAKQWVLTMKSAVFIIFPIEESIILYSVLHGDTVKLTDICKTLKEGITSYEYNVTNKLELKQIEKKTKKEGDIGSKEFQQMMFDRLGDRDYDSFEPNEHDYLKDKIGFARFGPPQSVNGYSDKEKKLIDETYQLIVTQNNKFGEWKNLIVVSFIWVCLEPLPEEKIERSKTYANYNPYTDITPIPIFVIRKCFGCANPCRIFVDCDNRVYSSWEDYISNNKLHKCIMVLPKNGRYGGDVSGNVVLERHASPPCSIQYVLLQSADVASAVVGVASGTIFLAAAIPAIAVAPIVLSAASITGIGVGVYSIIRSGMRIYDRFTHEESMSFENSEARGAYINVVAGTLGFVGAGATTLMSTLAAEGVHIGEGARAAINVLNLTNTSINAAALANATYEFYETWREGGTISTLSIIQLGSSVLFFGNAVYNFRTANTIINDAQTNALRAHQDSLRSNRHRKTFNKMVKETIRQNNGDAQAGRAEVISTISKVSNRDEVLAVLTRNNKLFNREGVRFAAEDGLITLNGVVVDLMQMGTLSKAQRTQFLIDLPPTPAPSATNLRSSLTTTTNIFNNVFSLENLSSLTRYGTLIVQSGSFLEAVSKIMISFSDDIKEKIFTIFDKLLEEFDLLNFDVLVICRESVSNENPYLIFFKCLIGFLKMKMNDFEEIFQENPEEYHSSLKYIETGKRAMFWFEKIVNGFVIGKTVDTILLNELLTYVMSEVSSRIYEKNYHEEVLRVRRNMSTRSTTQKKCTICGGYSFAN